jgi:microcystin-dependent protein
MSTLVAQVKLEFYRNRNKQFLRKLFSIQLFNKYLIKKTMSQPYIGEIRMFGGSFAPAGWAFCNGQLLPISENNALFILLGTTYGGDGQETFALPNLQSRIPIHMGQGTGTSSYTIGEQGGVEQVTLTTNQIPIHTHAPLASSAGGSDSPGNNFWGASSLGKPYVAPPASAAMNPATMGSPVGGSQPHENMLPFLCVSYIISLFGIFPSQT